jgi:predicted amidophosphoribosyltransferase
MQEFWESGLDDEGKRCAAAVIDLDSDSRTCPACTATFAAGPEKCPECGLFIGG